MSYRAVIITAANDDEANTIARTLVEEKLAACANLFPVNSIYRWQGDIYEEVEVMLMCKTTEANVEKLMARVKELHSYEVPEIIALPIGSGSQEYLNWVGDSVE